jgi:uncharacterized protein
MNSFLSGTIPLHHNYSLFNSHSLGSQKNSDDKSSTLEFDHSSRIVYMLREQHKIEYVIYPHIDSVEQEFDTEQVDLDMVEELNQTNGNSSISSLGEVEINTVKSIS